MTPSLYDHQIEAVRKMKNGCILCGGVGSGKSRTSIAYYFCRECGGIINGFERGLDEDYIPMTMPKNLLIITTARKRDTLEWEAELAPFLLSTNPEVCKYPIQIWIDSWNNIGKYVGIKDAFIIFDEQRVVGSGAWVKAFLKMTKQNRWILLSATPGDTWSDYIPVFIANGFFKNRTEFMRSHAVYSYYTNFPKIDHYVEEGKLIKFRNSILIDMDYKKPTTAHDEVVTTDYNKIVYKKLVKERWDFENDCPIENASRLYYLMRKVVNSDFSRIENVIALLQKHPRLIIFYNFDYELEILKNAPYNSDVAVAEWNGHKHEPIPETEKWVYLVQYSAGAEGWNCISTNVIVFFSQNYSYKAMVQASGRIDRLNTPYSELYYYHFRSRAWIDLAIAKALSQKKNFNERNYTPF